MGTYRVSHEAQEKIPQDSITEAVGTGLLVLQHHVVDFQRSAAHRSIESLLCFVDFSRAYDLGQSSTSARSLRWVQCDFCSGRSSPCLCISSLT